MATEDTPKRHQLADSALQPFAVRYVRLALGIGEHQEDYVDAYTGPEAWQNEVKAAKLPLEALSTEARDLLEAVQKFGADKELLESLEKDEQQYRVPYLTKMVECASNFIDIQMGKKFDFDEEAVALYDVKSVPRNTPDVFEEVLAELAKLLPGDGSISERVNAVREKFVIPKDKLKDVFDAAIKECRDRTRERIPLPEIESFDLEFVTDKAWSGYNYFKGNGHSLIQINTDLPIRIERAIDLGSHEGYPGHHVYHVLLEQLEKRKGWVELCISPLFSPQSLVDEGTANYCWECLFGPAEKLRFEMEVLYPLAGLDPETAEDYRKVGKLVKKLGYAGNEACRGYLNGTMTSQQAVDYMVKYSLSEPNRARQRLTFFDKYRSYVINYNLGQDMVKRYIDAKGGQFDAEKRWELFIDLISYPRLPSDLLKFPGAFRLNM